MPQTVFMSVLMSLGLHIGLILRWNNLFDVIQGPIVVVFIIGVSFEIWSKGITVV